MVQTFLTSWLRKQSASKPSGASETSAQPPELSGTEENHTLQDVKPSSTGHSEDPSYSPSYSEPCLSPTAVRPCRLPQNVQIVPISGSNVENFRRLVMCLLPIPYPNAFFKETVEDPIICSISRAAMWQSRQTTAAGTDSKSQLVSAIRCRLLASPPGNPDERKPVLYISTVTTLAPFRGHSLATALLQEVTMTALQSYGASTVMAHVWEANEDALEWYKKKGFRVVGRQDEYYRRLAPHTAALIVRKDLNPSECFDALKAPVTSN